MKIVFLDAATVGDTSSLNKISEIGDYFSYDFSTTEQAHERVSGAEVILANKVKIDKDLIDSAPDLKLICITATGTDNVDLDYAKEKGILIRNVSGYSTHSVAQHTFALLFYLIENLKYYDNYVKSGKYSESTSFTHHERTYFELRGKTWGVIGMGTIGQKVARIAAAYDCNVIYYSTSGRNKNQDFPAVSFDELLSMSDIISVHAPLNDNTKNLIGKDALNKMKKTGILLNVGRGGIINEKDLAEAINNNDIFGAGLDTLEEEPINADNPLLKIKEENRIFITPHMAWASDEARERLMQATLTHIQNYMESRESINN